MPSTYQTKYNGEYGVGWLRHGVTKPLNLLPELKPRL